MPRRQPVVSAHRLEIMANMDMRSDVTRPGHYRVPKARRRLPCHQVWNRPTRLPRTILATHGPFSDNFFLLMKLQTLGCAVLSLPLVMCFDVDTFLSHKLQTQLHERAPEAAGLAASLRHMLESYDWLHFDEGRKEWGPEEITTFSTIYLPTLKRFLATAMCLPEPTLEERLKVPRIRNKLLSTFTHLLMGKEGHRCDFDVGLTAPGSILALRMADAEFIALGDALCHFIRATPTCNFMHPKWPLAAATLDPMLEIFGRLGFINVLWEIVRGRSIGRRGPEYLEALTSDPENLLFLVQKLEETASMLPQLFLSLQAAMEMLVASGECSLLSYRQIHKMWSDGFSEPLNSSHIWAPHDASSLQVLEVRDHFIKAANQLCARLLIEYTLLQPKTVPFEGGWAQPVDQSRFSSKIRELLTNNVGERAFLAFDCIEAAVNRQGRQDAACVSADDIPQPILISCEQAAAMSRLMRSVHSILKECLPELMEASRYWQKTVGTLKKVYEIARRVVKIYLALLHLGRECVGGGYEWELFLLQFFALSDTRETLARARHLGDHIGKILSELGAVQSSDWDEALCWVLRCPRSSAKRAMSGTPHPGATNAEGAILSVKAESDAGPQEDCHEHCESDPPAIDSEHPAGQGERSKKRGRLARLVSMVVRWVIVVPKE